MEISAGNERETIGRSPRRWGDTSPARGVETSANRRTAGSGEEGGTQTAERVKAPKAAGVKGSSKPPLSGSAGGHRRTATVRVLVSIEDGHRVYGEAIGQYLRMKRPGFEVRVVKPCLLYAEMRRFGPQVVLHGGPPTPIPDLLPCWVELSLDPTVPTVLRAGRIRQEVLNPSLSSLVAMIEEAAPVCS